MIKIKIGNILNCTENIIIHQVNVQGMMGGGVAKQLSNKYNTLEKEYAEFCKNFNNDYEKLQSKVYYYQDEKIIANMFSQKVNFDTDYKAMKKALKDIKDKAKSLNLSVCLPYGIGCGIANGDWNFVLKIIKTIFNDYNIIIYKLEEK